MSFTRREFLRVAGVGTAGAVALGAGGLALQSFVGQPLNARAASKVVTVPSFCEMCFWKCGLVGHVEDGRLWKLTGNPADPLCSGRLCTRGTGGVGALTDPDRLVKPLMRGRERGEEVWREVAWEEALGHVAEKMSRIKAEYGPEAMALFSHGAGGAWFAHLLKSFGSPNIAQPSFAQCRGPRDVGFELTFGHGIGSPEPYDLANTNMVVFIGGHLGENLHNTQVQEFAEAIERGARIVTVDPRFSVAASKSHHWLPIKPGTDLALLLAWINVVLAEELYDKEYVAQHALGLAELAQEVSGYTPEWAYPHTGIPAQMIRQVAREMGQNKPGVLVYPGRHATWYGDDAQRSRAMAILAALLGSWGREGGIYRPLKSGVGAYPYPPYPASSRGPADGAGTRFPFANEAVVNGLVDATITGDPYPVKGWMVYATNLIQAVPDQARTIEAIRKLDLLVAIDTMPAEICGWADVILPECTYLERYDELWAPPFRRRFVSLRQPVVAPLGESKAGWWIAKELGTKLGIAAAFPWRDAEEYLETRLRTVGLTLDQLKREGTVTLAPGPLTFEDGVKPDFPTPSGKIELYSQQLKDKGFDPVPKYTPPDPAPEGHYRLLYGRSPAHTFGKTVNNPLLAALHPENEVWINVDTARDVGVKDGEYVELVNQDGVRSNAVKAKVTQRIRPECVYMVHGFGHTAKGMRRARGKGADDTQLVTRVKLDPLMGGTGMRGNFVRIEPKGGAE